jgi:hypothetical protein
MNILMRSEPAEMHLRRRTDVLAVADSLALIALLVGVYADSTLGNGTTANQSSETSETPPIQGVVTGYVTAGPSQPSCPTNQTCDENLSGYSLVFTPQCTVSASDCNATMAALGPGGHYSIFLPAGNYSVTGLYPSCDWVGCSSAFPKTITVEGGMQLVFNVGIDTGIR